MPAVTVQPGADHHLGPRLPKRPAPAIVDCFRCSEDRRVLRTYVLEVDGRQARDDPGRPTSAPEP